MVTSCSGSITLLARCLGQESGKGTVFSVTVYFMTVSYTQIQLFEPLLGASPYVRQVMADTTIFLHIIQ